MIIFTSLKHFLKLDRKVKRLTIEQGKDSMLLKVLWKKLSIKFCPAAIHVCFQVHLLIVTASFAREKGGSNVAGRLR